MYSPQFTAYIHLYILDRLMDDDRQQRLLDLQEQTTHIRSQMISTRSRVVYTSSMIHFLRWTFEYKPHLITDQFRGIVEDGNLPTRQDVIDFLSLRPRIPPLRFDDLQATDFINWVLSVRKTDGSIPVYSTLNGYRSALSNLFRDYGYRRMRGFQVQQLCKQTKCTKLEKLLLKTMRRMSENVDHSKSNGIQLLSAFDKGSKMSPNGKITY